MYLAWPGEATFDGERAYLSQRPPDASDMRAAFGYLTLSAA